jgi:hypothetical protein
MVRYCLRNLLQAIAAARNINDFWTEEDLRAGRGKRDDSRIVNTARPVPLWLRRARLATWHYAPRSRGAASRRGLRSRRARDQCRDGYYRQKKPFQRLPSL